MFNITLRRFDVTKNMARFYGVAAQSTLFGQWAVVRRWGRINTDGRRAETWFEDLPAAVACAEAFTSAKRKRGHKAASGPAPMKANVLYHRYRRVGIAAVRPSVSPPVIA